MASIRIRVGAAVDASLNTVFRSLVDSAKKAQAAVVAETKKSAAAQAGLYRKNADETSKTYAKMGDAAGPAADKVKTSFTSAFEAVNKSGASNFDAIRRQFDKLAADAETQMGKVAKGPGFFSKKGNRPGDVLATAGALGMGGLYMGKRIAMDAARIAGIETDPGALIGGAKERESMATKISNSAWIPGGTNEAAKTRIDPQTILADARKVATETASSTDDALAGLEKFVGLTGDLQSGRDVLGDMAKLSKATGANMSDVVEAAAQVSNAMGDTPGKADAIKQAMMVVAGQGQVGAVELKDLASQMGKLAAQANNFKIDPGSADLLRSKGVTNATSQNIAIMGAMAQAARATGGRVTAQQATQSSMAFIRDMSSKTELKRMHEAGIQVYADKGHTQARDPKQILLEIFNKTRGDLGKLTNLMPNANSRAVAQAFQPDYMKGANSVTREEGESDADLARRRNVAGMDAMSAAFDKYLNVTMDADEVQKKFKASMATAESQVQNMNNALSEQADKMMPEFKQALLDVMPAVVGFAQVLATTTSFLSGHGGERTNAGLRAEDMTDQQRSEQMVALRRKAQEGTATPEDKAALEELSKVQATKVEEGKKKKEERDNRWGVTKLIGAGLAPAQEKMADDILKRQMETQERMLETLQLMARQNTSRPPPAEVMTKPGIQLSSSTASPNASTAP